ncbi:MAG: hypothetical protein ICV51_14185, partial [Flavisolibacter sp.]|nr:hypothetical protein [Flavisolibacter sp.]
LIPPNEKLIEVITWLHENISKFRHLYVVHKHENDHRVRLHFAIGFSGMEGDDEAYFNLWLLYPQGNEETVISEKPQNVLNHLNLLLELWIGYLSSNRGKRNLTPNA